MKKKRQNFVKGDIIKVVHKDYSENLYRIIGGRYTDHVVHIMVIEDTSTKMQFSVRACDLYPKADIYKGVSKQERTRLTKQKNIERAAANRRKQRRGEPRTGQRKLTWEGGMMRRYYQAFNPLREHKPVGVLYQEEGK